MIGKLASILRVLLKDRDAFVPFRDELEFTDDYLAIEVVRFGEKLRVVKEISAATLDIVVPSMLLQPLIENSHQARAGAADQRGDGDAAEPHHGAGAAAAGGGGRRGGDGSGQSGGVAGERSGAAGDGGRDAERAGADEGAVWGPGVGRDQQPAGAGDAGDAADANSRDGGGGVVELVGGRGGVRGLRGCGCGAGDDAVVIALVEGDDAGGAEVVLRGFAGG